MTQLWPDDRKQILKEMWEGGYSAPAIAERLGDTTDSAVLKAKDRFGLTRKADRKSPCTKSVWTEERIELLRSLWGGELSGAQIASKIGGGISRNAVIGKAFRLGLPMQPKGTKRVARQRGMRRHREVGTVRNNTRIMAKINGHDPGLSDSLATPIIDDLAIPEAQRRSILELTDDTCHWPVGHPQEPGFFFCGAKANGASSYCPAHCRIAYTIPPKSSRPANWALQKPWMMQGQK